jgi:hypothetical protein
MAVQIRLSGPKKAELDAAVKQMKDIFSPTSPVEEGRKGDWLCYGILLSRPPKAKLPKSATSDPIAFDGLEPPGD